MLNTENFPFRADALVADLEVGKRTPILEVTVGDCDQLLNAYQDVNRWHSSDLGL